jgi:steroid delta-isomerase-like uncharacterized protein
MSDQENAATLERAMAAINSGDTETIMALFAPGYVRHDFCAPCEQVRGPEGVARFYRTLHNALPDLRLNVQEILVFGDRAVVYADVQGTHRGEFFGATPTGKRLQYRGVDLFRLEQGKIAETWPLPDVSGIVRLMQQN